MALEHQRGFVTPGTHDFGAVYVRHQGAMYGVAVSVLRSAGRESEATDVVHEAVMSILTSPPDDVDDWEALLISTTKRRALDVLKSARVRHAGPELEVERHSPTENVDVAQDVADGVDRRSDAGRAWDALSILTDQDRQVVRETIMNERTNADVATEFGLTPGRISQIKIGALKKMNAHMTEGKEQQ